MNLCAWYFDELTTTVLLNFYACSQLEIKKHNTDMRYGHVTTVYDDTLISRILEHNLAWKHVL